MTKSLGFALITAVLWGIAPVLAKIGLKGALSPLAALVVRTFAILVCSSAALVLAGKGQDLIQADLKSILSIAAIFCRSRACTTTLNIYINKSFPGTWLVT